MKFPEDYAERVYAGVLGKVIGVYLGRPFEGWSYDALTKRFGQINYYVNEILKQPLIVSDDDISGTFTFLRALEDYDFDPNLTAEQIGQTWLNYLIEGRTVLWWGGMGISTEHTAYMRLKHGHKAPASGSIALNSQVVAEQIGSQIFIDGWGMISPGDPARAADFARRAASVSHDGEAIYGAQVVAALVAAAFVEQDVDKLLDTAVSLIPGDSLTATMIRDIREWHAADGNDWRATRTKIDRDYGYHKYGGNCHIIPNHALIILALLAGGGSFTKSLTIVNTCGWDTDCNSGNVGAILGVRNGLAGLAEIDWRGPVADRMLLPTADGGRCITDAVREAIYVINAGLRTAGHPPIAYKNGARFSFPFPSSVQGFVTQDDSLTLSNPDGAGLRFSGEGRASTATFGASELHKQETYSVVASPTLYPGQTIRAEFVASSQNVVSVTASLFIETNQALEGPIVDLQPGQRLEVAWTVPATNGELITSVGVNVDAPGSDVTLSYLTWDGAPSTTLLKPGRGADAIRGWTHSFSFVREFSGGPVSFCMNEGRGIAITGAREWTDYTFEALIEPHLASALGVAARVQGLELYYALLLTADNKLQLIKRLDGEKIVAETTAELVYDKTYQLKLTVDGNKVTGQLGDIAALEFVDHERPLTGGGVGVVVADGNAGLREAAVWRN